MVASSPGTSAPPASTTPAGVTTSCAADPMDPAPHDVSAPAARARAGDGDRPGVAQHPPGASAAVQHRAGSPSTTTLGATRSDGRLGDAVSSRAIPGVPASPVIRHNPRPGESPASLRTGATRTAPVATAASARAGPSAGGSTSGRSSSARPLRSRFTVGPSRRGLARPPPGQGAPGRRTFETHQRRPRSEPDDGDVRQHRAPAGACGHRAPRPVGGAAMPEIRTLSCARAAVPTPAPPRSSRGGGPHVHAVSVAMTRSGRQQQRALVAGRRHVREHGRRHVVGRLEGVGAQVPLLAGRGPAGVGEPQRGLRADRVEGQRVSGGGDVGRPDQPYAVDEHAQRVGRLQARPRRAPAPVGVSTPSRNVWRGRSAPARGPGSAWPAGPGVRPGTARPVAGRGPEDRSVYATKLDRRVGAMRHRQRVGELERVQLGGRPARLVRTTTRSGRAQPSRSTVRGEAAYRPASTRADPAQRLLDVLVRARPHELGSGVGVARPTGRRGPGGSAGRPG